MEDRLSERSSREMVNNPNEKRNLYFLLDRPGKWYTIPIKKGRYTL